MQQGLGHASLDAWSGNLVATLAMAARHGIVNFASKTCCMAAGVRVSFSIFFASQLLPDMGVCALQRPKGPTYGCFRPLPASKGFPSGTQWPQTISKSRRPNWNQKRGANRKKHVWFRPVHVGSVEARHHYRLGVGDLSRPQWVVIGRWAAQEGCAAGLSFFPFSNPLKVARAVLREREGEAREGL